jgi:uncharacterized protein YceH (UPF0502 family)
LTGTVKVGMDDKHISMMGESGVALAAIQGLNEKVEGKSQKAEARIANLEQTIEQKETEITELKQRLEKLELVMQRGKRYEL